ncbi:MAG: 2Fe-2S iron-sulfur cluster-binding protein [Planctomycetota bacterium]
MKHFKVTFEPDGRQISIHAGATLVEAAGQAGIILNSTCGGKGTCGKCAVNLEPRFQQVLACQYRIQTDLTVTIPISSRFFEVLRAENPLLRHRCTSQSPSHSI